jgi:PhoPQ-activated pathogenicity-related protein
MPQPTDNFVELSSTFAVATGCIGADLMQVPNAPIVFKADPTKRKRFEDAIVGWTWKEFLDNITNPDILIFLPMTKAAVRGKN